MCGQHPQTQILVPKESKQKNEEIGETDKNNNWKGKRRDRGRIEDKREMKIWRNALRFLSERKENKLKTNKAKRRTVCVFVLSRERWEIKNNS